MPGQEIDEEQKPLSSITPPSHTGRVPPRVSTGLLGLELCPLSSREVLTLHEQLHLVHQERPWGCCGNKHPHNTGRMASSQDHAVGNLALLGGQNTFHDIQWQELLKEAEGVGCLSEPHDLFRGST